ncbi:MAG TPA: hypothetical protein ENJ52_03600 [Aliiroseovarius sp.]|nr:hypothetical protein [Aliiroseovarius sp.]
MSQLSLARVIHLDASDAQVYARAAASGEWAISGGFEFSNWGEADLVGKARQAFANGWLGLESFGRATLVAIAPIEADEYARLIDRLAAHFVEIYGAPDVATARPVAEEELAHMAELCTGQAPNMLLAVSRELRPAGVAEAFRLIEPDTAGLDLIASHGWPGD